MCERGWTLPKKIANLFQADESSSSSTFTSTLRDLAEDAAPARLGNMKENISPAALQPHQSGSPAAMK